MLWQFVWSILIFWVILLVLIWSGMKLSLLGITECLCWTTLWSLWEASIEIWFLWAQLFLSGGKMAWKYYFMASYACLHIPFGNKIEILLISVNPSLVESSNIIILTTYWEFKPYILQQQGSPQTISPLARMRSEHTCKNTLTSIANLLNKLTPPKSCSTSACFS